MAKGINIVLITVAFCFIANADKIAANDAVKLLPKKDVNCSTLTNETPRIRRLIKNIDCTKDYPSNIYFDYGNVQVKKTSLGNYREAEAKPLSRFGYRFNIENLGKPHLVVVRYPDDKRRYMCMMDGTSYDLTVGVFTGVSQPSSGKMLEIRRIFWPRWKDCSIVFMTWSDGEPAAVADIKIYELEELPKLDILNASGECAHRKYGIQFEDPSGEGGSVGAMNHKEWIERMIDYMSLTGQNILVYPIIWYHGPTYPSNREPSGDGGWIAGRDRKLYIFWETQPIDRVSQTLERFSQEGLQFQASLTLLRLGSLMKNMNIDLDSIKAGKDTYNNMLSTDDVQSSTQDWTILYNVLNYENIIKSKSKGDPYGGDFKNYAYGERPGKFAQGPMFNPVHPSVQKAILGVVQEIVDRYAKYPAFKGISINMFSSTITWFFTLKSGYDDFTINLFEKETGIKVPVDSNAPDRFSKRYEFLVNEHLEKWIDWRCHKIKELNLKMRDIIVAARPDLRLGITVWTEIVSNSWAGFPDIPSQELFDRKSTYDLCREGGFDINLYDKEHSIDVGVSFVPSRDRGSVWRTESNGVNAPLERSFSFRDHDFLDKRTLNALSELNSSDVFIMDSWVEAWGKHLWFACDPNDIQAKKIASKLSIERGSPVKGGIAHMNSIYPKDSFWWDWQLRITPPYQGGIHYMEYAVHALAELDACRITRGGLFLDTAHTEEIQSFVRAYRALPAQKFQTVGTSTDPLAVRTLLQDNRRYLYIVNREYYPIEIKLILKNSNGKAIDLATNSVVDAPDTWHLIIGPYGLNSYALPSDVNIESFVVIPPKEIIAKLTSQAEQTLKRIEKMKRLGVTLPVGTDKMTNEIKNALQEGKYAWLRRALGSYIIRKCDELYGIPSSERPNEKQIISSIEEKLQSAGIEFDSNCVNQAADRRKLLENVCDINSFKNKVIKESWSEKWPDNNGVTKTIAVTAEIWTNAIQTALNDNKAVYIPYRKEPYYIDAPLILRSGNCLIADPKAEIRLKPNTNTCMVRNEHLLSGANKPILVGEGSDCDIIIDGGIWTTLATACNQSNGNNNGFGDPNGSLSSHGTILLNNIRRVQVRNVTIRQCLPHGIQMTCCEEFLVENISFENHKRDGVHVNGPARYGIIRNISGTTQDDMISVLAWDWKHTGFSFGDIEYILVQDVQSSNPNGLRLLPGTKVYSDGQKTAGDIKNIVIKNIKGFSDIKIYDQPNLEMGRDNDFADPIGNIKNVYFDGIEFDKCCKNPPFQVAVNVDGLKINDVVLNFDPNSEVGLGYKLVEIGPKSMTYKFDVNNPNSWVEVFSPDKDCIVRNFQLSDVKMRYKADGAVTEKKIEADQMVKVMTQTINPDYPNTTPKGGTGRGILITND